MKVPWINISIPELYTDIYNQSELRESIKTHNKSLMPYINDAYLINGEPTIDIENPTTRIYSIAFLGLILKDLPISEENLEKVFKLWSLIDVKRPSERLILKKWFSMEKTISNKKEILRLVNTRFHLDKSMDDCENYLLDTPNNTQQIGQWYRHKKKFFENNSVVSTTHILNEYAKYKIALLNDKTDRQIEANWVLNKLKVSKHIPFIATSEYSKMYSDYVPREWQIKVEPHIIRIYFDQTLSDSPPPEDYVFVNLEKKGYVWGSDLETVSKQYSNHVKHTREKLIHLGFSKEQLTHVETMESLWKDYYKNFSWAEIDIKNMTLTVNQHGKKQSYDDLSVVSQSLMNRTFKSIANLSGPVSMNINFPGISLDSNIFL